MFQDHESQGLPDAVGESAMRSASESLSRALGRIAEITSRRPRVILLGEENAGKTSLANALLGFPLLPESVLGNTRVPVVLRRAERLKAVAVTGTARIAFDAAALATMDRGTVRHLEIGIPSARLDRYDIIDTPGVVCEVGLPELTPFDIPVWCTLASQAWKESERRIWHALPRNAQRIGVLAVTSADNLDADAAARVRARLANETAGLFHAVVLTSAPRGDATPDIARMAPNPGVAALDRMLAEIVTSVLPLAPPTVRRIARLESRSASPSQATVASRVRSGLEQTGRL